MSDSTLQDETGLGTEAPQHSLPSTLHLEELGRSKFGGRQDATPLVFTVLLSSQAVCAVRGGVSAHVQVFMLPSDRRLDEATLQDVLVSGHSRVPVHEPGNRWVAGSGCCCVSGHTGHRFEVRQPAFTGRTFQQFQTCLLWQRVGVCVHQAPSCVCFHLCRAGCHCFHLPSCLPSLNS